MTNNLPQSFWIQLQNSMKDLKSKRLADVFRFISFRPHEHYGPHAHLRIEINFVEKGSCSLRLEDGELISFKKGEIMLINSHLEHFFQAGPKGATLMQLEFLPELLGLFNNQDNRKIDTPRILNLLSEENKLIRITDNIPIMRAIQRIINELNEKKKHFDYLVIMYYAELLILLQRHLSDTLLPLGINDSLKTAMQYIHKNYQTNISIKELAELCKISERYLRKLFSDSLNCSPLDYLNDIRIQKSIELLKQTELSIKEVAFACGFKSSQYFSRVFKRVMNITPTQINRK